MFKNKTLIVVGAGASNEVDLPTGFELKSKISKMLNFEFDTFGEKTRGDGDVFEAIKQLSFHESGRDINSCVQEYVEASQHIRNAMPQSISIDNFLDAHQGNVKLERCGKLAIVKSILEAERSSRLFFKSAIKWTKPEIFEGVAQTWFNLFFQLLAENCRIDQIKERLQSVDFVIFNYDRCIEHFLYHSLQNYYGISEQEAAELVKCVNFFHPYGTVGNLPWHKPEHAIEFGGKPSPSQLIELAKQIRTFTEGTNPKEGVVLEIRSAMRQANVVLFLGFAFHRLNLEMIQPADNAHLFPRVTQYFATAFGLSDSDRGAILNELVALGNIDGGNVNVRSDLKCSDLFHEYWRSLSLS